MSGSALVGRGVSKRTFHGAIEAKSREIPMTELPPAPRPPRVVIAGAGFGGLSAAKAFARRPFDVTVIDAHNYHLFQPLLYQVATAGLSPADIASPIRS